MPETAERIAQQLRHQVVSADQVTPDLVVRAVRSFNERSLSTGTDRITDEAATAAEVLASMTGYGQLQPLIDDPTIEEIWINDPTEVFVAREGITERVHLNLNHDQVRHAVERMLAHTGRRVDLAQPFVDASLPDGSRLHVVIPDITRSSWSVNIRKFHQRIRSLDALAERGMLSAQAASFLRQSMRAGLNIVVAGPTHAGKTTMLAALLAAGNATDRVVTVEETFEIACTSADVVAMQCRPANLEGVGEISLRRLVKEALRMRPDRLVVGEVREAESLDLLIALNSGIPGLATIHANSARDALMKLCTLPLLAGRNIDANFVVPTVASAVDLVVHCRMANDGTRYVSEILATTGGHNNGVVEASTLFTSTMAGGMPTLTATGVHPIKRDKFEATGIDVTATLVTS